MATPKTTTPALPTLDQLATRLRAILVDARLYDTDVIVRLLPSGELLVGADAANGTTGSVHRVRPYQSRRDMTVVAEDLLELL